MYEHFTRRQLPRAGYRGNGTVPAKIFLAQNARRTHLVGGELYRVEGYLSQQLLLATDKQSADAVGLHDRLDDLQSGPALLSNLRKKIGQLIFSFYISSCYALFRAAGGRCQQAKLGRCLFP